MNVYPFIEAERVERSNARRACVMLEVSRAAYYGWARQIPSARQSSDEALLAKIKDIHTASRGTYGSPRVHAQLRNDGQACGRKRVARRMRHNSIVGRCKRRFRRTTIADPDAATTAVDLVKRSFVPDANEIDRLWCSDVTYIRTWEGWLYLATVIDVASRRVVGWAMADHMRTELVCDALRMAIQHRRPAPGLILHSDRGSQYASTVFGDLLDANGIRQSLSRPGQCWDNAVAESFFATLKTELVHMHAWPTRAQARNAIFEFMEVFYNRLRLHSALRYLSPDDYQRRRARLDARTKAAA